MSLIIGLLTMGVLLVLLEIFLPGGVSAAIGMILIIVGIILGFRHDVQLGLYLTTGLLILTPISLWAWLKYFPSSRFGKKIILEVDAKEWRGYSETNSSLLGKTGVVHNSLRPGGTAMVDGERVDVVTQGPMLDKGTKIKVIEVVGNRVVVEEFDDGDDASSDVA
jgi:membrane-bound serine protease (ClpP class)